MGVLAAVECILHPFSLNRGVLATVSFVSWIFRSHHRTCTLLRGAFASSQLW